MKVLGYSGDKELRSVVEEALLPRGAPGEGGFWRSADGARLRRLCLRRKLSPFKGFERHLLSFFVTCTVTLSLRAAPTKDFVSKALSAPWVMRLDRSLCLSSSISSAASRSAYPSAGVAIAAALRPLRLSTGAWPR
jgi:hypothetical protein